MGSSTNKSPRGRGAARNPTGRFERLTLESQEPPRESIETRFQADTSRSIIAFNRSPDLPFDASINPYRGCEHGCVYCYARPTHEFLGFSAGLDFESRILVKEEAPELLRRELQEATWRPQPIAISGVTDAYQPVERRLRLTRGCLEVLAEHRNPVMIVTKNALVTRDIDLLRELAENRCVAVYLSIATLDGDLARRLEPRASHPRDRIRALARLADAGIPCGVLVAPVIPGLTEPAIPGVLDAAAGAGARYAGMTLLRLPGQVAVLFSDWLEEHFPDRKRKVLNRVRAVRGGRLNDSRFGSRMRGQGVFGDHISSLFHGSRRRANLERRGPELSTAAFRRSVDQLSLFS